MGNKDNLGWSQPPGYSAERTSAEREFLYLPCETAYDAKWLASDTLDNQNSGNTTRLRAGLVLVPNVARTLYVHPEHADAVAAADLLVGDPVILAEVRETKDDGGTARSITAKVLTLGSVIDERILFGSGTSSPNKALIKAAMPRVLFVAGHEPL